MSMRGLMPILGLLALTGCTAVPESTMSGSGQGTTINGAYRVTPDRDWHRKTIGLAERWTVAGARLHQLRLYGNLQPGDRLFPESSGDSPAQWQGRTRAHDVADFLRASLARWGAIDVTTTNLRPASFGGEDGFRMELSFADADGLEYTGLALGTTTTGDDGDRLQLILYFGTTTRHFEAYREDVEDVVSSVELVDRN